MNRGGELGINVINFSGAAQFVIPANAGIQADCWFPVASLDSRVRGNDACSEPVLSKVNDIGLGMGGGERNRATDVRDHRDSKIATRFEIGSLLKNRPCFETLLTELLSTSGLPMQQKPFPFVLRRRGAPSRRASDLSHQVVGVRAHARADSATARQRAQQGSC
jgi:hypothetical protein